MKSDGMVDKAATSAEGEGDQAEQRDKLEEETEEKKGEGEQETAVAQEQTQSSSAQEKKEGGEAADQGQEREQGQRQEQEKEELKAATNQLQQEHSQEEMVKEAEHPAELEEFDMFGGSSDMFGGGAADAGSSVSYGWRYTSLSPPLPLSSSPTTHFIYNAPRSSPRLPSMRPPQLAQATGHRRRLQVS